jgi:hydroxypyruvate isomerase
MLSRRGFGRLMSTAVAARVMAPGGLMAQAQPGVDERAAKEAPQFSVMMWALNKRGSFEENLERVAQAGYRHVELVGEFMRWS